MLPDEIKQKRVLISPLNWGMGHVARCIPLIDKLIKNQNTIVIAASEDQQQIFKHYFPNIEYLDHEGYPFNFGTQGNFGLDLAKQFTALRNRLKTELQEVELYVEQYKIDVVISDHRYGFRSEKTLSILLTHQLNLPVKWYEGWVQLIHHRFLKAFNEIWVPDTIHSDLSGDLSKNTAGLNTLYIGSLSRFSLYEKVLEKKIDKVIVVSGPSVYGQKFLEEQLASLETSENSIALIAPKEIAIELKSSNVLIQRSDDWLECDKLILQAKKIVSRSGYSTLMDLVELQVPFSISPTPGQREQEYLFELWNKNSFRDATSFVQD